MSTSGASNGDVCRTTLGATGDALDMATRLRATLPARWFPDISPTLDALLGGFGAAWAAVFDQIVFAQQQTRLRTVSGGFLDMAASDFRGLMLQRRPGEADAMLRARLLPVFRDKATRAALIVRLTALTGAVPWVFEPSRPADTGGYGRVMGYGSAGGYGSLALPNQVFVSAQRPIGQGIPNVSGYGSDDITLGLGGAGGYGIGAIAWERLAAEAPHITDADLYGAIVEIMPAASIAWVSLSGAQMGGVADLGDFTLGLNSIASA